MGLANTRGLKPWSSTTLSAAGLPDLKVTATPCRHGPPLSRPIAGEVVGFALEWDGDPSVVWLSGDTVLYHGVREVAQRFDVDVAVLHLGAVRFPITGPLRYSMNGHDATELITLLQPRVAVPVHFEGWSHFHQQEAELHRALDRAPDGVRARVRWLIRGQPMNL